MYGIVIDLIERKSNNEANKKEIHKICQDEHCNCEEDGVVKSALKHTIQIFVYIFIISLVINSIIFLIGEEVIAGVLVKTPLLGPVIASLIGMIPNCASSVILTELYIGNIITIGSMIGGLLVNSGVGLLVLFKVNKNYKDNISILGILYIVGVISGIFLDLFI